MGAPTLLSTATSLSVGTQGRRHRPHHPLTISTDHSAWLRPISNARPAAVVLASACRPPYAGWGESEQACGTRLKERWPNAATEHHS